MPSAFGVFPLSITGARRPGAVLRLQDPVRAIATCGPDPYQYDQSTPLAAWVINHRLGFKPNIRAYGIGGREMLAEVLHVSDLQSIVYFDFPTTGFATCS